MSLSLSLALRPTEAAPDQLTRVSAISCEAQVGIKRPRDECEKYLDGDGAVLAAAIGEVNGLKYRDNHGQPRRD